MKAENRFLVSPALLVMAFSIAACHSSTEKADNKKNDSLPSVLIDRAQVRCIKNTFSIAGQAAANEEVEVFAMEDGYVKRWNYDIGDFVKKGDVLAILVNPDIIQEQEKAQAELDGDESIYKRFDEVYKKAPELVPLEQVDESKAKYGSALAALDAINSRISYLIVRAPFDGIITNRYVDTGAVVQNGLKSTNSSPLFKIQDISVIRLNVNIPEVNSPYVTKGTPVSITFIDLPNSVFTGTVSRVSYGLDADTKTMLAQIDLQNKNHIIHPGMFANVKFVISATDSVLSVPDQAVGNYEQQAFIYKVMPVDSTSKSTNWDQGVKCVVKKVNVQLGVRNADYAEIKHSDLKAGDMVVISGNALCADGSLVNTRIATNK